MQSISFAVIALAALIVGCSPNAQRPGTALSGAEAALPADWRFTDATKEIQLQVHTPYLIPHAVTIWCAQVDGALYVAASAPSQKRWPSWVDRDPNVRLDIDGKIYDVKLVPLESAEQIDPVRTAYATKYQLPANTANANPAFREVRYWHVVPRETSAT